MGSTLSELPQTLEDAMACVRSLGKRYLGVDSVCIDQSDGKEKRDQIGKMSSISSRIILPLCRDWSS